jgi:hypothetical protein
MSIWNFDKLLILKLASNREKELGSKEKPAIK